MADTKISDLVELGGASLDDLLVIVDVDDTSMATSGTNKKIKASNVTGLLAPLAGGEVSVTGATTATVSRMHVCSGTTANYTVTLPPASGNLGTLIGFRMAAGLTKLVTLDGNASETIDGALTRVLWAGETAILLCDGAGWLKIAGKTIPMNCKLKANATQTGLAVGFTKLALPTAEINVGSMADTTNSYIVPRRDGNYCITAGVSGGSFTSGSLVLFSLFKSTTEFNRLYRSVVGNEGGGTGFPNFAVATEAALSAGDQLNLQFYNGDSVSRSTFYDTGSYSFLTATEVPAW